MNSFLKTLFGINKNDLETGVIDDSESEDAPSFNATAFSNTASSKPDLTAKDASAFYDAGIYWEPKSPRTGDTLNIHYHGLLQNSEAGEIFLHYGFDNWNRSIHTIKMARLADGSFSTAVKTERAGEINLCFKDNADNWDNNNGNNWNLSLQ
jgi:hypothetical protein